MRAVFFGFLVLLFAPMAMAEDAKMAPTDRGPAIGTIIPSDLSIIDQSGKVRNFAQLTGPNGLVLVFVRSAKWCPFCKGQLKEISTGQAALTQRGFGLAALSYDDVQDVQRFAQKHEINYPILADRKSEVINAFGIRNEKYGKKHFAHGVPHPMIFILAPDKTILAKLAEEGYRKRPAITAVIETINALPASAPDAHR